MGRRTPERAARRPAVSPEDQNLFLEAIAGATPLPGRDRVRQPPVKTAIIKASITHPALPTRRPLTLDCEDGRISGRAEGVNRAQVSALRTGKVRAEATLDLHGDTVAAATPRLEKFLLDSARDRRRCVLVIHGKGLHSDGVAVLRDAVLHALAGPLSGLVQAFSTAAPADGGDGATAILVKP